MVIVTLLGITLKDYLRLFSKRSPKVLITCPYCERKHMQNHGRYIRTAVTKFKVYHIPIYRRYCPRCEKTVSLLPYFVAPHQTFLNSLRELAIRKHIFSEFSMEKTAQFISSKAIGTLSARTIYRWKKELKRKAPDWLTALAEKLLYVIPGLDVFSFSPGINAKDRDIRFLLKLGGFYQKAIQQTRDIRNLQLFSFLNASSIHTNFL